MSIWHRRERPFGTGRPVPMGCGLAVAHFSTVNMSKIDMDTISLMAAATVTNKSKRSLWRLVSDGGLVRGPVDAQGRATVSLISVREHVATSLSDAEWTLLVSADRGDAEAQNDMALFFLAAGMDEHAHYWLGLAAKQNHGDALHWLARCHFRGLAGADPDQNLGMMYLAKAAAAGHVISQMQIKGMQPQLRG